MHQTLFTALCAGVAWLATKLILDILRPKHVRPPGPKPLPIIGNVFDMPVEKPWETYTKWCKQYGSNLIYLDLPMQPTILVGSAKAALELFDKRSHIYSDRQRYIMLEMLTWDFNIAFMRYGPRWRAHRRSFHQYFNQSASDQFRPLQLRETRKFLSWILETPKDTRDHLRRTITAIILDIVYGMKLSGMDDPYVHVAEKALRGLSVGSVPGAFWVEYLPFLQHLPDWVPFNTARKVQKEYRESVVTMREKPYDVVKADATNGTAVPSVALTLVHQLQSRSEGMTAAEFEEEERIARNVTGIAYGAGADTTTSACESFLLAMTLFPEVQRKAQAELDRVVGPSRLPDFEDVSSLVYIRATAMEAMRWMPVVPFSVPHRVVADDVYDGYVIRKGTVLIPNTWGMLHDPEDYPEPERFNPDRYIGADGEIDPNVRDPNTMAFGYGRRICPGRYLSNNALIMLIASILHVFDVTPGVDEAGKPIELSTDVISGLISGPLDVPCGLKPRSESAARLIREAALEAEVNH